MKSLFGKFRKQDKAKEEASPRKKEDLETLIADLKQSQAVLNIIGSKGDKLLFSTEKARLKELEEKIISLLPDEFQKKVFRILVKHNVNLLEFVGENKNWKETLRAGFNDIAFYLDPKHPLNIVGKKLPVAGKDFLFWMLQQAKAENKENRYLHIGEAIKKGNICGYQVSLDEKVQSGEKLIDQIVLIAGIVMMSGEYNLQFRVLMEIMCDTEGGEEFIREELYNKVKEDFFEEPSPSYED